MTRLVRVLRWMRTWGRRLRDLVKSEQAAAILFCFSLCAIAFSYGILVDRYRVFPHDQIRAARNTAVSLGRRFFGAPDDNIIGFSRVRLSDLQRARIVALDDAKNGENLLFTGGWDAFREFCPQYGCVAVELRRDGSLARAYPLRPEEFASHIIAKMPHELLRAGDELVRTDDIFGIARLPDGGLIVTVFNDVDFPNYGGIARLDRDGHVLWYRHTYDHHWPYIDGNRILVATSAVRKGKIDLNWGANFKAEINCGVKYRDDGVRILDLDGRSLAHFSVLDAIVKSRYRAILYRAAISPQTAFACDPLHLNYVRPVGPELAAHLSGVAADDILVSLRHISAFAIIGAKNHEVKRLYTGSFRFQHAVQPYSGSSVLIFDNVGVNADGLPSRVLSYDLATSTEHVLLSNDSVPGGAFFSQVEGVLDMSADRKRLLVTVSDQGDAYELRLSDLKVLTRISNLQDVNLLDSAGPQGKMWAQKWRTHGIYYVGGDQ